jgi:hypothetical protein
MTESLAAATQLAHSRVTVLRYLLIAFLVLKLLALGSAWAQHEMLVDVQRGVELTAARASANDSRELLISRVALLFFVGTAIWWLMWQHRAYANLRLIGSRDTEYTPGWSVGYWFIPFINLYRPYQITAELYRRSEIQNGRDPVGGLSGPPLVGVWWFVYLAWGVTSRFVGTLAKDAQTVPTLISATNVELVAHLLGAVVTVLALLVIGSIDRFQQALPMTDQIVAQ